MGRKVGRGLRRVVKEKWFWWESEKPSDVEVRRVAQAIGQLELRAIGGKDSSVTWPER